MKQFTKMSCYFICTKIVKITAKKIYLQSTIRIVAPANIITVWTKSVQITAVSPPTNIETSKNDIVFS